ncbi:MAG TPA: amidohydrolase [Candidatus Limnocylindria bacterium]
MSGRADLVVFGQVLVAALPGAPPRAEAVGIAEGRVVSVGSRETVLGTATAGARVVDARDAAVVPGLHDFHVHLVGLARARAGLLLDDATDGAEVATRIRRHAAGLAPDAWITGRGWSEAQLSTAEPGALEEPTIDRPAFVTSHDGHSAWASAAAMRRAGIGVSTADPPGGRLERDPHGQPTGILRETALDLVSSIVPRLQGAGLRPALEATIGELCALGVTGASEAGDYTDANGVGADAELGDSYSSLTDLADLVDGRLRITLGIPVDAIPAAAARGLQTGLALGARRTMRFGWAKEYADGALGSGTAALFEPRTCGAGERGIMRVTADELDGLFAAGRRARIGLAVHAIGDRAAAEVLDAVGRAPTRPPGVPDDRMEHAQLVRVVDRARFAPLRVTASVQPIHAAADRDLVDACWDGRQADAYAWRGLLDAGALLAAGSDAPVESVNPWLGIHAALHRRLPSDLRGDWRPEQALTVFEALAAYTLGPARAIGATDEGHLRAGARADLAVLSVGLDALLAGEVDFGAVRSDFTVVDGRPVG